jgi:hypothetical protein
MEPSREETPESLERTAEELARLACEHGRDLTVAGDLIDLAEKYLQRAAELRRARGDKPIRPPRTLNGTGRHQSAGSSE